MTLDRKTQQIGLLFALTTSFFWGFLAVFLKYSVTFSTIMGIVWLRFTIAFIFLFLLFLMKSPKQAKILKRPPWVVVFGGILLSLNYLGFFEGVSRTSASNTQILIQIGPLALALIGVVYFKEKLVKIQKIGFLVALFGFFLFYRSEIKGLTTSFTQFLNGNLWIIFGAATWTVWAFIQKIVVKKGEYNPQQLNLIFYGAASLFFLPLAWNHLGFLLEISLFEMGVILFLGLNTLIAYGCVGEALKRAPANQVSLIITLNPLITLGFMALLYELDVSWVTPEKLSTESYIGAFILILGVILVTSAKRGSKKNK